VGLTMERPALYARIDARVEAMLAAGLLAEVEGLLAAGYRKALTAAQAIGYKELVPVVEGSARIDDAAEAIKQATRRYAKRQLTWFRADPRIHWIDVTGLSSAAAADAVYPLVSSGIAP
jgi:tRNA dimethylallyltransferase